MKDDIDAKERDRQYHMDAINRLASFLGFHGTSFEVVQAAMDNMSRMKSEIEMVRREPVAWMVYTHDGQSVYVTDNPTDIQSGQRALPLYTETK